jgi:hypothetical protein
MMIDSEEYHDTEAEAALAAARHQGEFDSEAAARNADPEGFPWMDAFREIYCVQRSVDRLRWRVVRYVVPTHTGTCY